MIQLAETINRVFLILGICITVSCMGTETDNPAIPEGADFIRSSLEFIRQVEVSASDRQALSNDNLDFAADLYRQLARQSTAEQNICVSPYGIGTTMGMLYAGARGQSQSQMADALHFNLDKSVLFPAINQMRQDVQRHNIDDSIELVDVSALFFQKGTEFESPFLDTLSQHYDTGVYTLDMDNEPDKAKDSINQWASDLTDDNISMLFDAEATLSRIVLANAIYLNGPWYESFDVEETKEEAFTNLDGSRAGIEMMRKESLTTEMGSGSPFDQPLAIYHEEERWQIVAIPYQDIDIRLILVLPSSDEFRSFEQNINGDQMTEILSQLRNTTFFDTGIEIAIPKFYFENSYELSQALSALSMEEPFLEEEADFSGVSSAENLYLQTFVHKSFIGVDEVGTHSGTATWSSRTFVSVTARIILNRPFFFFIWDSYAEQTLFMGRVAHL